MTKRPMNQIQGDVLSDMWQHEKNLTKAARVLGESKSHLHTRETTAKTKVNSFSTLCYRTFCFFYSFIYCCNS